MSWKELMVSASMAVGQLAAKERDRLMEKRHRDGRPKAFAEKTKERIEAVVGEGAARVVVSQTAHLAAKEISKRVGQETVKKIAKELAKRPALAAGTAFLAFDAARDGVRLGKGQIDANEFAERMGGHAGGAVGSGGGAVVGAMLGTAAMPVVGTVVGSVIGSVLGGVGGDTFGRHKVRQMVRRDDLDT